MMTPELQPVWRKSSFSTDQANCVEVGAWQKSTYSTSEANCVEVGAWNKSSFSSTEANCVEVGGWNKSSYSTTEANCVEVTATPSVEIGVRDTKDRGAGHLTVSAEAWTAFLTSAATAAER
ncbi:DUF397 domain-containing protein [Amycolatopsis rhabdoformis]|uniref:DUF397 domain-containing protein n=1 Tax=Amycolatopsis rhabdoformis TaxID=1448059 RepID=A0ABZ1I3T5_9PSEU|nr:DUF397 domain-containing protein [Amycolatopsis rhabdoformis]WSE28839.1 DUF397 domain-containing protein [Amycolatopsis rhabdoformis]